jgi:senataxin
MTSFLRQYQHSDPFDNWPLDPPPAGLLVLMMDESPLVRTWAKAQCSKSQTIPIPIDKFSRQYRISLDAIIRALTSNNPNHHQASSVETIGSNSAPSFGSYPFAPNPGDLWSAFASVLRFIPPDLFTFNGRQLIDIRHTVTGHLHDVGPR